MYVGNVRSLNNIRNALVNDLKAPPPLKVRIWSTRILTKDKIHFCYSKALCSSEFVQLELIYNAKARSSKIRAA